MALNLVFRIYLVAFTRSFIMFLDQNQIIKKKKHFNLIHFKKAHFIEVKTLSGIKYILSHSIQCAKILRVILYKEDDMF